MTRTGSPRRAKRSPARSSSTDATTGGSFQQQAQHAVAWLKRRATKQARDGMARYGIPSDHALGVPVGVLKTFSRQLGRSHELAAALWDTGIYEARMLACFVDEPAHVTAAQMDRWCRDFDNWAIADHATFHLFDRTPHAFDKVAQWATRRGEFERRAAFALLASLALHDRGHDDRPYARTLPLIEAAAVDDRNFVKKAVSWALRAVGERSPALHTAALDLARRLAASPDATARWVGKDAARALGSPATAKRLAARSAATSRK